MDLSRTKVVKRIKLVDRYGNDVKHGQTIWNQGGEAYELISIQEPHKPSSTGRVYVQAKDKAEGMREFFPGVFNLTWIEDKS